MPSLNALHILTLLLPLAYTQNTITLSGSTINGKYCPGAGLDAAVVNGATSGVCCVAGSIQVSDCPGWPICTGPTTSVPPPQCSETISFTATDYDARISSAVASLSSQGIVYVSGGGEVNIQSNGPDSTAQGTENETEGTATATATESDASGSSGASGSQASGSSGSAASASQSGGAAGGMATGGASLVPFGLLGLGVLGLAAYL
jgi:hypothetical protein